MMEPHPWTRAVMWSEHDRRRHVRNVLFAYLCGLLGGVAGVSATRACEAIVREEPPHRLDPGRALPCLDTLTCLLR